ncbi:hypothetical protein [Alkalicoccus saliphilus]|uniref:Uncharacterized protein n=1 Tax=Alkalicoccus saliphilus TaxID=200989 RepID=A0A2T4U7M0_9BACI|nr:hypothetical protein [Alkalicoccus saliphilus]PTL39413.1 hypothetical protein C6Y45_06175 [Alkalicoccus saliphilus]
MDKAKSEDPFPWPKGWKIADDEPHGKLPPGSAGESYTLRRIIILKPRLNQHSGNVLLFAARFVV